MESKESLLRSKRKKQNKTLVKKKKKYYQSLVIATAITSTTKKVVKTQEPINYLLNSYNKVKKALLIKFKAKKAKVSRKREIYFYKITLKSKISTISRGFIQNTIKTMY